MFDMNGMFPPEPSSSPPNCLNVHSDIKATTAVLTTAASLLALSSLVFSLALIIDWTRHLFRPRPKTSAKEWSDEEASAVRLPLSTRTLGFQTAVLSFLTVWLFAVLIPSTIFVRTRSAHLTIQNNTTMVVPFVDARYWDYGFCKYSPPPTIFGSAHTHNVQCDAWEQHRGLISFSRSQQASLRGQRGSRKRNDVKFLLPFVSFTTIYTTQDTIQTAPPALVTHD